MLPLLFVSTAAATASATATTAVPLLCWSLVMSSPDSSEGNLRIYLARHGQDEDNAAGILNGHRDQPLTSIGMNQASTVAEKIRRAGLTFDAIYSSPLQRAHKTAQIIASEGQCLRSKEGTASCDRKGEDKDDGGSLHVSMPSVQVMDQLIERNFGVMTGTPTEEIRARCSGPGELLLTDTISYFLKPEGAETFPDLIQRAKSVIADIVERHEDKGDESSVLLVTHGDFGKMMYAAYYQLQWEDVLKQFHFGNSEVLLLSKDSTADNAHVFEIEQFNH